jgi:hypothetical protein
VSPTELIATSPPHVSGTVDVTVTTAGGTSAASPADQFTYLSALTVTEVCPNMGPASGGTRVKISGTNFTPSATVNFGSTSASAVIFVSPTELIAISPPHVSGTVDVTVTTAGGTSAASPADQFTYFELLPPRDVHGYQIKNRFASQTDIINVITWRPPSQGEKPVAYKIYRDAALTKLVAVIDGYHEHLRFEDHHRRPDRTYTYFLVSIDEHHHQSSAIRLIIKPET